MARRGGTGTAWHQNHACMIDSGRDCPISETPPRDTPTVEYLPRLESPAAERLAWGALQNRRHLAHGGLVPRDICAGCRRPIGVAPALDLIDGNRVHDDAGPDCLIGYGERWRDTATRALVAMGLSPPAAGDDQCGGPGTRPRA